MIDSLLGTVLFGNLSPDDRHLSRTREAWKASVLAVNKNYGVAVTGFFSDVASKYKANTNVNIIPKLIFDKDFMTTFMNEESEAIDAFKKSYVRHDRFDNIFKKHIQRVVCHDLTTDVVTLYSDWPTQECTHFLNLDDLTDKDTSISENIATLNIGLQDDSPNGLTSTLVALNYIPGVGLGRYEQPHTHGMLFTGAQEGRVFYFLDDAVAY